MNKKTWLKTSILGGLLIIVSGGVYAGPMSNAVVATNPGARIKPVVFPLDIKFDTDKALIKPGKHNEDEFKKLTQELNNYPYSKVEIQGYTDSTGAEVANQKLSEERAEAVRQHFMKSNGIAADRIQAVGFGETKPAATNQTVAGRTKNRRVIATIYRLEPNKMEPNGTHL